MSTSLATVAARSKRPASQNEEDGAATPLEIIKLNDIEHALHAADFYIGQAAHTQSPDVSRFVYDPRTSLMSFRANVQYPHGLLKIFDEALVNAADNRHRGTTLIKVGVSVLHNSVWVYNDGPNFAIVPTSHDSRWDPAQKAYQPEVAFFHCKTSSAYGKKQRVTGGKFGLGAKLIAIFSQWCTVEMCDGHMYYFQKAENHMNHVRKPTVRPCKKDEKPYLALCFSPDLSLFYPRGQAPERLPEVMLDLFMTRALDVAGTVPKEVKVLWSLNRDQFMAPRSFTYTRLPIKGFKDYVKLFIPAELKAQLDQPEAPGLKIAYHSEPRWEVCMIQNPWPMPVNVSFVNNVNTYMGGEHVKYIQSQVYQYCKNKVDGIDLRRVQHSVMVFVNAMIEDPSFTSQCKETLQTLPSQFGSSCTLPDKFFNTLSRNGVLDDLKTEMEAKELTVARRVIGASKTAKVHDIPNLHDAQFAGTRQAQKCTLILVEGTSALSLAEAGLSVLGSEYWGAFPVKGKIINADNCVKKLQKNKEFVYLCRIMGLEVGREVQRSQLRYGRVLIFTDADPDGSHIRGLIVYFFAKLWPGLLKEAGFLQFMITPIVTAARAGSPLLRFYTLQAFQQWFDSPAMAAQKTQWQLKYYKGLATSTTKEGRFYFKHLREHIRGFQAATQEDLDALSLVFGQNTHAAQHRQTWLHTYDKHKSIPYEQVKYVSIQRFLNEDLIHFSWLSVCRALPACEDGLTPAARKCVWTFLKRNIVKDKKVCILQTYVDEDTNYHHGPDSLGQTIIRLAQTFVGAQNANLFYPSGQFGTRLDGGDKTVGATRYIFSHLASLTRTLFCAEDDALLQLQDDEGKTVEPVFMAPVIPLLLVNGAKQVGTGYACKVPCFRPEDLIAALERKLAQQPWQPLQPWYHKFTGTFSKVSPRGDFVSRGVVKAVSTRVWHITELPVRVWREKYKETLVKLLDDGVLESFHEKHRKETICFEVTLKADPDSTFDPYKVFKLQNRFVANLAVFTTHAGEKRVRTFDTVEELFEHWFAFRLPLYELRRQHLVQQLEQQIPFLQSKVEFIRVIVGGQLSLGRKHQALSDDLEALHGVPKAFHPRLFKMGMHSLTEEHVLKIERALADTRAQLEYYRTTTPRELWTKDLNKLKAALPQFWTERMNEDNTEPSDMEDTAPDKAEVTAEAAEDEENETEDNS